MSGAGREPHEKFSDEIVGPDEVLVVSSFFRRAWVKKLKIWIPGR